MANIEALNKNAEKYLPGHLGIELLKYEDGRLSGRMEVKKHLMAPNGFLHGGSVVSFADSLAGMACLVNLPEGAKGFTTIELKTNFLGTSREGVVMGEAVAHHLGKTTHVWDAKLWRAEDEKTIALFRCTQMILR